MKATTVAKSAGKILAGVLLFCGMTAWADTPPASRVARLTFLAGYVHIDTRDHAPGDPAELNMPLVQGQTIVTGENGQAEVEFEDGSLARVTPNSALSLARLSTNADTFGTHLVLGRGLAYFELRSAPRWEYTVEAAGDIITPVENTTFRVNLDEPPAAIAVLSGTAHVERQEAYRIDVGVGETLRSDSANLGRYFLTQEIATDTWDQWNESRDQEAVDAAATQTPVRDGFAGNQGYGWSDLDANGNWYNVPGQGQVWQPSGGDSAAFDPYANGSWMWYPNAGYLWASSYSWGWTPFRCGAWSFWSGFGWGWSPNGGCGGFGFSGYGGGFGGGVSINVVLAPRGYPFHRIPPPSGGVHPVIRIAGGGNVDQGAPRPVLQPGLRHINGANLSPILPVGHGYTARGGTAVGASLQRDFPVERSTRTPILGNQPDPNRMHTGYVSASPTGVPGNGTVRSVAPLSRPLPMTLLRPGLRPLGPQVPANSLHPAAQPASVQAVPQHVAQPTYHPTYSPPPAPVHYAAPAPAPSAPHYATPAPAPAAHPSASAPSGKK